MLVSALVYLMSIVLPATSSIFLMSCLHHVLFSCTLYYSHFSHFNSSCFSPRASFMYPCTYSVHRFFVTYTLHEHYYASVWNRSWPLRLQPICLYHSTTVAIADSSSCFILLNPFFRPTTKLKGRQPLPDPGHLDL